MTVADALAICYSAIVNEMDEQQAIEYVRDTAIERRTLSVEQRLDIIFKCEDLMGNLVSEAKKRQNEGLELGRQSKIGRSGSMEPNQEINKRTNEVIADMAGYHTKMCISI